jgi:biotin transport system permease protein
MRTGIWRGQGMLTLTAPVETALHRVPAGVKLALLALGAVGLFAVQGALVPGVALGALAVVYARLGLLFFGLRLLWPLWPFLLILAVWHGWVGTWAEGLAVVLRLVAAVAVANLVTMTTRLSDMIAVITRLARPLRPLGLPPDRLALMLALVIRFIPVLSERIGQLRAAWAARSARRAGWAILVPATLAALDDAERVAEALRARGGAG